MFAKIFNYEHGQILVTNLNTNDGPEVRIQAETDIPHVALFESAYGYKDTKAGREMAQATFDHLTEENTIKWVKEESAKLKEHFR